MAELNDGEHGLTFPCEFPIKAMGPATSELTEAVWHIVTRHAPQTSEDRLRTSQSRGGRYVSVTVTITAESRAQLDTIYAELSAHDQVLATL